jgi:hypothetical protein
VASVYNLGTCVRHDLGFACGLGMHRLIRPGLHVWPRHIGLIRAWAARVAWGHLVLGYMRDLGYMRNLGYTCGPGYTCGLGRYVRT